MGIFQRLGVGFARFMYGRNGMDQLNRFLLGAYVVLWVLRAIAAALLKSRGLVLVCEVLWYAAAAVLLFRMFSKNLPRRQAENQRWISWSWRLKRDHQNAKARHADKEHKYFTCKSCKTICRVPAGKGKIVITCPKCGAQIRGRT